MVFIKVEKLVDVWKRFKRNDHFKFGIPFALLVAGCFYYLNQTQSVKFVFNSQTRLRLEDLESFGFRKPDNYKRKSLEEIYGEVQNKDISNWENKRIPRPWKE